MFGRLVCGLEVVVSSRLQVCWMNKTVRGLSEKLYISVAGPVSALTTSLICEVDVSQVLVIANQDRDAVVGLELRHRSLAYLPSCMKVTSLPYGIWVGGRGMLPGEVLVSDLKYSSTFLRVSIPCQCSMNNGSKDVILEISLQGEVLVSPLNALSIILRVLISCYSPLMYGSEDMVLY